MSQVKKKETTKVPSAPSIPSLMKILTAMSASTCAAAPLEGKTRNNSANNARFEASELKCRQKNSAAASVGRAWLAQSIKASSDGTVYYETKTAEGSPEERRCRHPHLTLQGDEAASPPRKNASHLGRSRDSFLLKLVASHNCHHGNAEF